MSDFTPDPNLNRVAGIAADLGARIRDEDPRVMYGELVALCAGHPAKAAQLLMCLAAWFDPDEPAETLFARVKAITSPQMVRTSA